MPDLGLAVATILTLAGLAAASTPSRTSAQASARVVVVDPDETLRDALRTALEPYGLAVESVADPSPGAQMPGSARRGMRLARRHAARAAIWVSTSDSGYALWVYDARQDRVVARPLPTGPPFSAPVAAEVALVAKTLLRQGPTAPAPDGAAPPSAPRFREWTLMTSAGARFGATAPDRAEARFALWLTLWPAALARHLGFALVAESGPGLAVDGDALSAHWTETSLRFALRGRIALGGPLDIGATVGFGAQLTTLHGSLPATGQPASRLRVNPMLDAELDVGLRLDERLRLELRVGSGFPLRRQTFLVGDARGLRVEPASARGLLSLEVSLD